MRKWFDMNSVLYCIAFAKDENTLVYREQAKLMLESLVRFGGWDGKIVVFTNLPDKPLTAELPQSVADRIHEITIPFDDFSTGKEGKLPSARFRIHAWKHFDEWKGADFVVYIDTDCIVRRPISWLIEEMNPALADIMGATVANRNMARSKWFHGHITPEYEAEAERTKPVQSGTIVFRGSRFQLICREWANLDRGPSRPGVHPNLVTDQSSHNLLHLLGQRSPAPIRSALLSPMSVACPHVGQRKTLGHEVVNDAAIWHYWHLLSQEDRVVAMRSELDRLGRAEHPAPNGLIGTWRHQKAKEKILNHWTFHHDGLITVDEPAICGRWEWQDDHVLVDWLWGWEKVFVSRDSIAFGLTNLIGESFRNGAFLLSKL